MDAPYTVYMMHFTGDIKAAARVAPDGHISIYINDQLSREGRKRALKHELEHIANDDWYNDRPIEEAERVATEKADAETA